MTESKIEQVARAIDSVQLFSRFDDWSSDRVEGLPIEICRYGKEGEDEIVVLRRFPAQYDALKALREVISYERARAAIEAMREPNEEMIAAAKKACGFEETQMLFKVLEDAGLAHLTVMKWTGDIEYRAMIDAALQEEASK